MKKYWIRPIALCQGDREGSIWTYMNNIGKPSRMCIYSWYIEGSDPKILVDTGCQADLLISHLGFPTENIEMLDDGLHRLGIKPEDIDIVIFTHLHGDHAALSQKFRQAKFIVQKAEYDSFLNPHPYTAKSGFYDINWLKGLNIQTIEGDQEIADGIRVIFTPGHSHGSQSVAVDTPKGTGLITGFCCTYDNFNPPPRLKAKGIDVIPPGRHIDVLQSYDSAVKVLKAGYKILPCHDPAFIGKDRLPE
jgi:N-acyl homoserine lactone hydrolase